MAQQGDALIYQTNDDGEITLDDGLVTMSGGLEGMAYLCLFGGNEQDDGRQDSPLQWWGNWDEPPERQQRSEVQYLLRSIPAIPANLRRLEDAAERDLGAFLSAGLATSISVQASMPAPYQVQLVVHIDAVGGPLILTFTENWKADA